MDRAFSPLALHPPNLVLRPRLILDALLALGAAKSVQSPATSDLLQPVAGLRDALRLAVRTSDYLDLVAWSGSVPKMGKASLRAAPHRVLRHLGYSLLEWQEQLAAMRPAGRAVGGTERVRELAEGLKRCWVQRGQRMRQTGHG